MDILIIHWMIHPDKKSREDLLAHWREKLTIDDEDRVNCVGEFLSDPLTEDDVHFPCEIFESSDKYRSFFNVGMWRSAADFKRVVWDRYGEGPKLAFEFRKRKRMVLSPRDWRIGLEELPDTDNF